MTKNALLGLCYEFSDIHSLDIVPKNQSPLEVMPHQNSDNWNLPGTYVFNLNLSRKGYAINKMCNSLTTPENRERYLADEEAYMEQYHLNESQKQAIRDRDWLALTKLGGNLFFFLKLGATVGHGLYQIGAQLRGESYEEFLKTRNVPGAV